MVDADIVAIDDCVFLAIGLEVSADARKIREWERIQVVSRKGRKTSAARTIAQVISRNRSAVWSEDRADRCYDVTAAGEPVCTSRSRLQQLAEVTKTHSCRWHWHAKRIARAAKDRRTVSLSV